MSDSLYTIIKKYNVIAEKRLSFTGTVLSIVLLASFLGGCVYFAAKGITGIKPLGIVLFVTSFMFFTVKLYSITKISYEKRYKSTLSEWQKSRIRNAIMGLNDTSFINLCLKYLEEECGLRGFKYCINHWRCKNDAIVFATLPGKRDRNDISFINNLDVKGDIYIICNDEEWLSKQYASLKTVFIKIDDIGGKFACLLTDVNPPTLDKKRKTRLLSVDTARFCFKMSLCFGIIGFIVREWGVWFAITSSVFGGISLGIFILILSKKTR